MKIRELTFSRGETINTGNFNSVRVEVSATATVDEGEGYDIAYQELREFVLAKAKKEVLKHRGRQ